MNIFVVLILMFLQGFRRKELDCFKGFCELNISFFSFVVKSILKRSNLEF
jgi:hypothetical protein